MVGSASLAGLFLLCAALFYPIAPCSVGRFFLSAKNSHRLQL